ncbi:ABC transporter substrate-binding protein [Christensenellaceae bacterium OttesenSCG-928-L17]|nr:ABC transporter substrate-binding protein [Christensenellaceae bacterium OttesenSCG-928-L17]
MHRTIRTICCLFFIFAMTLSLAACNNAGNVTPPVEPPAVTATPAEETPDTPADTQTIVVVDQAGRTVEIDGSVEKIVSGYYISSSTCIALGLENKLVGIEAKAANRPIYAMAAPALLELPNVGTAKEFNLEGCVALEPDLVILPKRLQESAAIIEELSIPVLLVNPEGHAALVEMIALIGQATGANDTAAKLIAYYNDELKAVAGLTAGIVEKPNVLLCGNSAYLETAPKDMYQASLIDAAGGVNAAAEIEGDNWVGVSYEQFIAMNPDVIVVPGEASYTVEDILGDAQLRDITAVREKAVYQMPKGFEAWDSPVPSCTLGIRWMLYALHENLYPLEELQTCAAEFYREFYHMEIDIALIGK